MEQKEMIGRKVTIKDSGSVKQWKIAAFNTNGNAILVGENGVAPTPCVFHPARLELVLQPEPLFGNYLSVGGFRTTPDEALEWFVFLMLQAADLFTNIPGGAGSRQELERLLTVRGEGPEGPCVIAALAYFDAAEGYYKADEDEER